MDIKEKLRQLNERLKAEQVRCRVVQMGHKLYLQGTLPPKPGGVKNAPHQQWISLGCQADAEGLKLADAKARLISAQLSLKIFSWEPFLPQKQVSVPKTVEDFVTEFEKSYFQIRERNPKTQTTWNDDYARVFRKLNSDKLLTTELLQEIILATLPNSRTRRRYVIAAAALAKFAGIEIDKRRLIGRYSPRAAAPRDLPEDSLICKVRDAINSEQWRWAFGILAAYGIRPHELFYLNLDRFPIVYVTGGKTGFRHIRPIYPEWPILWNLQDLNVPKCSGKSNSELGNRVGHAFRRYNIPFRAYDLRHRWAVRSLEFGYDLSLAAAEMGHSVAVHSALYHHWISQDVHDKAFERLLSNPNRLKPPV